LIEKSGLQYTFMIGEEDKRRSLINPHDNTVCLKDQQNSIDPH